MEYKFVWLDAARLDTSDETFRVRRHHSPSLGQSIAQAGIRTPLLVEPIIDSEEECFRLVSGWGRWLARPDEGRLPVFLLPANLSPETLWDLFLEDNDGWNVTEIACILARLEKFTGLDAERITREKLKLLGVRPSRDLYRQYRRLFDLGDVALDFIEEQRLPLRRTAVFFKLPPAALDAMIVAARELRLTLGELTEWLELIEEIADREGVSTERVLEEVRAQPTPHEKERLRSYLRRRRYPELYRYQGELEECRRRVASSLPLELQWDPRLERPGLRLTVELKDRDALDTFLREFAENREAFGRFFEIL